MKRFKAYTLAAASLLLTLGLSSCADDETEGTTAQVGEEIDFEMGTKSSRTYYGNGEGEDQWQIYWQYGTDQVRVFSHDAYTNADAYNGKQPQMNDSERMSSCSYLVTMCTESGEKHPAKKHGLLQKISGNDPLLWNTGIGDKGEHTFYAIYPGDNESIKWVKALTNNNGTNIGDIFSFPYPQYQNTTFTADADGNYTAAPNMKYQYLVDRNKGNRTNSSTTFDLSPIMTTLEVTLKRSESATGDIKINGFNVVTNIPKGAVSTDNSNYSTSFCYKIVAKASDRFICNNEGAALTSSDNTEELTTSVNTSEAVSLGAGKSITFTIFLPPCAINADTKIQVLTGTSVYKTAKLGTDVAASAKKKVTLPTLD